MRAVRFTLRRLLLGLSFWSIACLGAVIVRSPDANESAPITHALVVFLVALPLIVTGVLGGIGSLLGRTWDAIQMSLVLIGLVWLGSVAPFLLFRLLGFLRG